MKISVSILMLVFALVLVSPSMEASVITTFDQNVAGGTGFYNGTGGVDGGFTNTTATFAGGSMTASLRLGQRFVGPITPSVENNYTCQAAEACNVEFSVWTDGGLNLSNFTYSLTIDDITNTKSLTFDPLSIQDNSYWTANSGGVEFDDTDPVNNPNPANYVGFENSEYLGFSFISAQLGGWNSTDNLLITLSVTPVGLGSDPPVAINVNASGVPEPASAGLIGLGLIGLGLMRRKFKTSKS
jgi:hypothetical protein